jgi:hypothetical protein
VPRGEIKFCERRVGLGIFNESPRGFKWDAFGITFIIIIIIIIIGQSFPRFGWTNLPQLVFFLLKEFFFNLIYKITIYSLNI